MDLEQYKQKKAEAGADGIDFGGVLKQNIHSARAVAQGVTLGYADEMEAWMRSGGGIFTDYTNLRDEIRADQDGWARENPWVAGASEIGGAFVTGVYGMGKYMLATAAEKGLPSLMKVIGYSMAEGAASGHGHGKSDDVMEQVADTVIGGALGAGAGAVGLGVVKAGASVTKNMTAAQRANNKALKRVRKALDNSGIADADKIIKELEDLGDTAVIADLDGMLPGFRPAALDAGEAQFKAHRFLRDRAEGRSGVLRDLARKMTGIPESPLQYSKKLAAQRRAEANVNYAPIMRNPVDASEPILRSLETGSGATAFKRASDDWYIDTGERVTRENAADITDLNFWNNYQSHLGDAARAEGKKINSNPKRMRGLVRMRDSVLKELDGQVPEYVNARRTYAKQFEAEDAIELGRKSIDSTKLNPEDMLDDVMKMGADQKRAFLKGVMGAVETKIRVAPDTSNTALKILRRPGLRERIEAAFGGDKTGASHFIAKLRQQARQGETESAVLYGSRTAPMQNEANAAGQALNIGADLASGNWRGAASGAKSMMPTTIDHGGNSIFMDMMLSGGNEGNQVLRNALQQTNPWTATGATGAAGYAGGYAAEDR